MRDFIHPGRGLAFSGKEGDFGLVSERIVDLVVFPRDPSSFLHVEPALITPLFLSERVFLKL